MLLEDILFTQKKKNVLEVELAEDKDLLTTTDTSSAELKTEDTKDNKKLLFS